MRKSLLLALALLVGLTPGLWAQVRAGNIYGTVTDESGAILPGANVTISGVLGTRSTTSDASGEFRFLNLDRGTYKVTVALSGFAKVVRDVNVVTGENVNLTFPMKVAQVEETVTVTAETPLVDTKKQGTTTTLTTEELNSVPNARDPWAILRTIPGVLVDRINVAGNENGQQANFVGKGATPADNMWNLDGIVVTDMSAAGASPTYFDYDAFQEIAVTTGGNDLRVATGGIGLNFVTKRGTNRFSGGARFLLTHDKLESSNLPDELATDSRLKNTDGTYRDKAFHIQQISDYGFDLGGPILKDKLWFYGSYGKQDVRLVNVNGTADKTLLPSYNAKVNWQATGNDMVSFYWFLGEKQKFGRSPGSGLTEPDSYLWNQAGAYSSDFHGLWKGEINHTFNSNFFLTAKYAYYGTGFGFEPRGGRGVATFDNVEGVAIGSSGYYNTLRPQKIANLDGNYFLAGMGGSHEFKFGFGYREATVTSLSGYGGTQLIGTINSDGSLALLSRDRNTEYTAKYVSAYLGDTFTKGALTLNLGVRWDHQYGENAATSAPANASFPTLLPALDYAGGGTGVDWNDTSPRLSLTYAIGSAKKTVARASLARYAGQLSAGFIAGDNPLRSSYLAYGWNDVNGDKVVQKNEVDLNDYLYAIRVDPANPGAVGKTANKIDPDFKANHDNELILGLDHELVPNLAVSVAWTYRKSTDLTWTPRVGFTSANYTKNQPKTVTKDGVTYTAVTYSPDPALVAATGNGQIRTNRNGYARQFNGLELTLMKRLSNKWMARIAASYNDWTEKFDGTEGIDNPTSTETNPLQDGGQVSLLGGGSGRAAFYSSVKWQVIGNALYQLPWGVEVSGAFFAKQGGTFPKTMAISGGLDGTQQALASPAIDTDRYPNVFNVDLRVAKNIKLSSINLALTADAFNVLNSNTELGRTRRVDSAAYYRLDDLLSPRVLRFGARFSF